MERHPDRSDQGWTARPVALVLLGMVLLLYALPAWSTQTVRVGIYDNPPKVFLTPNGVAAGLYPDILDAIARERGWTLAWVSGTWQECLDRLKSGEIDLMIDIAKTKERSLLFRFSQEPVLTNWGAVYARKGVAVQSFSGPERPVRSRGKGQCPYRRSPGIPPSYDIFQNSLPLY